MRELINDLLTYSRVGTRGKPLEATDCNHILDLALANLSVVVEETGAVVTRDPLPWVLGDATQLIQLFQNLIANAVKFRGEPQAGNPYRGGAAGPRVVFVREGQRHRHRAGELRTAFS